MNNSVCPNCKATGTIAPVAPPSGCNSFMLIGVNTNGAFNIPPNGMLVQAQGCTQCGFIMLGSPALIGAEIVSE